jgi:hypothetical protein
MTLNIVIINLPNSGGTPITDIEYELNENGTWISLGTTVTGTYASTAELGDSVRIRARNAIGAGPPSLAKTISGELVAPTVTVAFAETSYTEGVTIDISDIEPTITSAGSPVLLLSSLTLSLLVNGTPVSLPHTAVAGQQLVGRAQWTHPATSGTQTASSAPLTVGQVANAAPTLAATGVRSGRTYTVTVTSLTGSPPPSLIMQLSVNGQPTPFPQTSPGVYQITFGDSAVDLNGSGVLTATNNVSPDATFSFSFTVPANVVAGSPVNPSVASQTFTPGGGGSRASLSILGTYSGDDSLLIDMAFGSTANGISVNASQLAAQSGGTGVDAFTTLPVGVFGGAFDFNRNILPSDLNPVTTLAAIAVADRIIFRIRETLNGGGTGVFSIPVSGLDAEVPVFASATTDAAGGTITVTTAPDETLTGTPVPAEASATVNGSPRAINSITIVGGRLTVVLSSVVVFGDTIALTYSNASGAVRDLQGNPLTPFSAQTVTNGVLEDGGEIISITYDTAGAIVEYTGTLSATYDTAGVILEAE